MEAVKVPAKSAQSEIVEKKSRFIGHIRRVSSAEEAMAEIGKIKKEHYDAKHNVYAYLLQNGGAMRYSDDGEPQGTAGMPVLEVLRRENVTDVLCVVTRYFGGILLGAGGLTRAYAACAKQALDLAGACVLRMHRVFKVTCSYHDLKILQNLIVGFGCEPDEAAYEAEVSFSVPVLADKAEELKAMIIDATAGRAKIQDLDFCLLPEK